MNRNDIIRMAQEAGVSTGFSVHIPKWDKPTWLFMRRFAALIASAEREACAKVCDKEANDRSESDHWTGCASYLAHRIRSRGKA